MAVQAGTIGQAQVLSPSATLSNSAAAATSGGVGNNAAGWAWFWFIISLLFLVFTHLSRHAGRE